MADEQQGASNANKFPKAIYFLLAHFSLRAFQLHFQDSIATLFWRNKLGFSSKEVSTILRIFSILGLALTPIGALVADSMGNKYILMVIGDIRMIVLRSLYLTSAIPNLRFIARYIIYTYLGMSISTGFLLSSAVLVFSSYQFKLPEQMSALSNFYRIRYIVNNVSAGVGYFIAPVIRKNVPCLGEQDCYILPFSINVILLCLAFTILVSGTRYYVVAKAERNMALDIPRCIWHGAVQSIRERKANAKDHWMDHASPKFDDQLIDDIKRVFSMVIVFTVIPIYAAVYSQFQVEWLFQATRTDGRIGSFTIIEEHFGLLNPVLAVILAPIFTRFLDPVLKRLNMYTIFKRLMFGAFMVAIAFVLTGIVESFIKWKSPVLPKENEAQVRIFNGFNCSAFLVSELFRNNIEISSYGFYTDLHVPIDGAQSSTLSVRGSCLKEAEQVIYLDAGMSTTFHIKNKEGVPVISSLKQQVKKSESGFPILTIVGTDLEDEVIIRDPRNVDVLVNVAMDSIAGSSIISSTSRTVKVVPDPYTLFINGKNLHSFHMYSGGVYLMTVDGNKVDLFTITEPNSVHMAWMFPQSVLLIFGEVYFGITMAEFVYSEAPSSLKLLINAFQQFAEGIGNTIFVMILNYVDIDQDHRFYLFAFLLMLNIAWLFFVGRRFKSRYEGVKLM